jgi:hypothetical protein
MPYTNAVKSANKNNSMSSRLSGETIASLHEKRSVNLMGVYIGDKGAWTLADALKKNMSVTDINLENNGIGDELGCVGAC